jgi:CBS domain-containing protein
MSIKKELRHAKREPIEELTALRDEAKLQLHLLSMDARTRWNELEREIAALEEHANRDGEKAADALQETARRLTRTLSELMAGQVNHAVGLLTSVRSLMTTHVRTCRSDDSLVRAAQLMWETDCGAVPILSYDRVVGVITDRDVCMASYTQGRRLGDIRVDSAMSKVLFSCGPDESVGAALATMADKRVRRLPVLNENGKLLGIISISDVTRWARPLANPTVEAALTDALAAISVLSPQKLHAAAE